MRPASHIQLAPSQDVPLAKTRPPVKCAKQGMESSRMEMDVAPVMRDAQPAFSEIILTNHLASNVNSDTLKFNPLITNFSKFAKNAQQIAPSVMNLEFVIDVTLDHFWMKMAIVHSVRMKSKIVKPAQLSHMKIQLLHR